MGHGSLIEFVSSLQSRENRRAKLGYRGDCIAYSFDHSAGFGELCFWLVRAKVCPVYNFKAGPKHYMERAVGPRRVNVHVTAFQD